MPLHQFASDYSPRSLFYTQHPYVSSIGASSSPIYFVFLQEITFNSTFKAKCARSFTSRAGERAPTFALGHGTLRALKLLCPLRLLLTPGILGSVVTRSVPSFGRSSQTSMASTRPVRKSAVTRCAIIRFTTNLSRSSAYPLYNRTPPAGTYHGDSDLQLERINVYFNEATGGRYGESAFSPSYVRASTAPCHADTHIPSHSLRLSLPSLQSLARS